MCIYYIDMYACVYIGTYYDTFNTYIHMLYCICVYTYKDIGTKYIYTIEYIHISPFAARSVEVTQKFISSGLEK